MIRRAALTVLSTFLVLVPMLAPAPARADSQESYFDMIQTHGIVFAGICNGTSSFSDCKCRDSGECELEDVLQVFVNISNFLLSIVGSIVLIIFIFGGFLWLTSAGASDRVQRGQKAMTGSIVGLLIVLGAFAAINFLTGALRGGGPVQTNYCELVGPPRGFAGQGYACLDNANGQLESDGYVCEPNLCPGPTEIQCCRLAEPFVPSPGLQEIIDGTQGGL